MYTVSGQERWISDRSPPITHRSGGGAYGGHCGSFLGSTELRPLAPFNPEAGPAGASPERSRDHRAGPAGLTAAYQLAKRGSFATVLEADTPVGGISRTAQRDGWRFDIGGHRFFTKVKAVEALWYEILDDDEFLRRPAQKPDLLPREVLRLPDPATQRSGQPRSLLSNRGLAAIRGQGGGRGGWRDAGVVSPGS